MKTKTYFPGFLVVSLFIVFCTSCTQSEKKFETSFNIENTLKSVSLVYDSIGVDPSEILLIFEGINSAIDSIGYPDAGYKIWLVQNPSNKNFRFMLEGNWPNQAIYDTIHNHKLYKSAGERLGKEFWNGKKSISYNRFMLVK